MLGMDTPEGLQLWVTHTGTGTPARDCSLQLVHINPGLCGDCGVGKKTTVQSTEQQNSFQHTFCNPTKGSGGARGENGELRLGES